MRTVRTDPRPWQKEEERRKEFLEIQWDKDRGYLPENELRTTFNILSDNRNGLYSSLNFILRNCEILWIL